MAQYEYDGTYPVIRNKQLFNLDSLELTEENKDAIKFIWNCKQYSWPPWIIEPKTEHACLVENSRRLFVPLCKAECVMLDRTYGNSLKPGDVGLKSASIGIGSFEIWHGSYDARIRGTEVVYDNVTGDETDSDRTEVEENCDSDISYGTTTTVEAKIKFVNSDRTEAEENYDSDSSYGTMTTVEAKKQYNLPQLVATSH